MLNNLIVYNKYIARIEILHAEITALVEASRTASTDTDMYCFPQVTLIRARTWEKPREKGVSVISVDGRLNRIAALREDAV